MIRVLLISLFLTLSFFQNKTNAQAYDECSTAIQLGVAPMGTCATTEYTNVNATLTDNLFSVPADNIPTCWSSVNHDVWFEFQTPADGSFVDFEIKITSTGSNPIGQFKAALYRGECLVDELAELGCAVAAAGETEIKFDALTTTGLTPGISYFIRIDDQSSTATPVWGTFNVCVDSLPDIDLMCDATSSTASSGLLYDSGGPDGDYQNGENCTFTICPTAPTGCIFLSVTYDTENNFDELNFYDGTNVFAPQIGDNIDAGGSCYSLQATSGCVTIEWDSDGLVTSSGFEIEWESSAMPCPTFTNPNITTSPTEALILEKLKTLPTAISNLTVNCADGAHAAFDGTDNSYLFMEEGIVLTTGSADYAFSINDGPGDPTTDNNNNTDPDLIALSNFLSGFQPNMNDACVLEMDVLAASDIISMEYIFGSDEYLGNVNFNPQGSDVVGIWISGAGIAGDPIYNNQQLISVIPNTTTPVHLSTINHLTNFEYFRYNYLTDLGPRYDGLTTDFNSIDKKTLTASAQVEQCSTYHLKVAIADTDDGFFGGDSGIFFGDLNVGLPQTALTGTTSYDYLVEGCTNPDELNLNLSNPLGEDLTLQLQITGTADQGTDYTLTIPNTITFAAGQTNMNFPITLLDDGISEGTETIELNFTYDFGCGASNFATIIIEILDDPQFMATNGVDTLFVCSGNSIQLDASGASSYTWTPAGTLNNPNIANPIANPTTSQTYTVTGILGGCTLMDEVLVEVIDPAINISASGNTNICDNESVQLVANNNVNNSGLSWSPSTGLDNPNSPNPIATPPQTITYTATISIAGCSVSDQITVNVDPFVFPTIAATDTTICLGDSLILATATPASMTNYAWSPAAEITNPDESDAVAHPTANTLYTLVATSPNAYCSQSATVNVEVVPATLEIQGEDYYELCLGETVDLTALTSTAGVGFTWSPDSSLTSGTATMVTASPDVTTNYIAQLIVGGCTLQKTVTVQVDSLPTTAIELIPQKDTYCKGEIISFISPSIEIGFFPNIEFAWTPNDNSLLSDADNLNLAITATESQTYIRTTTNGNCSSTDEIPITVVEVNVEINTSDLMLCVGEMLELEATGADSYTWFGENLSCMECQYPTFTAWGNNQITVIGISQGCTDTESFNVTLAETPLCNDITISSNDTVGVGESIQLSLDYDSASPATVEWTLEGNSIGQENSIEVTILEAVNNYHATATNSDGCSCTIPYTVYGVAPKLTMANVFTPDGDGVNDFFNVLFTADGESGEVEQGKIEVLNFSIFNRWGNVVYKNETPATGWNGKIKEKIAPSDVYVYFVEIKYPNGNTETINGDVTLVR